MRQAAWSSYSGQVLMYSQFEIQMQASFRELQNRKLELLLVHNASYCTALQIIVMHFMTKENIITKENVQIHK